MGLRRCGVGLMGSAWFWCDRGLSTTFGGEHLIHHSTETSVNIEFWCTLDLTG